GGGGTVDRVRTRRVIGEERGRGRTLLAVGRRRRTGRHGRRWWLHRRSERQEPLDDECRLDVPVVVSQRVAETPHIATACVHRARLALHDEETGSWREAVGRDGNGLPVGERGVR